LKAKKDLWSVGVLAYALLSGGLPFVGTDPKNINDINDKIRAGEVNYDSFKNVSESGKAFCKALLHLDVTTRWTAEEALNSAWVKEQREVRAGLAKDEADLKHTIIGLTKIENDQVFKAATFSYLATSVMSKEEQKRLKKIFTTLDVNNDGTLSFAELCEGYKTHLGNVVVDGL
jgi:serine/threonine protein kinase